MKCFNANNTEIWSSGKNTDVSRTPGFSLQICYQPGESYLVTQSLSIEIRALVLVVFRTPISFVS